MSSETAILASVPPSPDSPPSRPVMLSPPLPPPPPVLATAERLGPEQVRALRGTLSRAAFARRIGVTANTVYRWELPSGAREARRPRGAELERLERLARGEAIAAPAAGPAVRGSEPPRVVVVHSAEDLAEVLPSVERIFRAEARRGQTELVQLLAKRRDLSDNARAAAGFGIAIAEIALRSDAKSALLAIAPALADAEAGKLEPQIAARVYAAAALVHSLTDASVFDLGHVHAYAARAELLAARTAPEVLCLCLVAALIGAKMVGDRELLERAFARFDEADFGNLPPLLALQAQEFGALRPMLFGKATTSAQSFAELADRAGQSGYPMLEVRSLAHQAQCDLDNLGDPEGVLGLARRAHLVSTQARAAASIHQVLIVRAEAEALFRLGRTEQALEVLSALEAWADETGIPPVQAVPTWMRVMHLMGRADGFAKVSRRLRECEVPALRPICKAYLAYVEAMETMATSPDPELMVAAFDQAEAEAKRWPFLLRLVLQHRVLAHVIGWQEGPARMALRRAQRFVEAYPAPWITAHLRRIEGTLMAAVGSFSEGRQLLESAVATFELARDAADAALARYIIALFAEAYAEPGAAELVKSARAALDAIGIEPPNALRVGMERLRLERAAEPKVARRQFGVEALVVPLQRLSVRGALPQLVLRELVSIASGMFPERSVRLDELDSAGTPRPVSGAELDPATLSFTEFSDGAGRTFRIGLSGEICSGERAALSVLTTAASLALESATLRGYDERRVVSASDERSPEIPGFLAASPAMRKLRAELARLAGSTATVIITGESGVGKEVVARAIHDLSDRASKSYVAFNCATVPRDLFEGQLFGYRRGAFTGAASDHAGVIRAASGGTLFLDEIGELPLEIQPKLLRFLENGEIFPLGERRPLRVDVRVLAATHRNLGELVRLGRFREDLYYRLQVVPLQVPPLRDRREDIPVLARHFVRELTRRGDPPVLAPDAIALLVTHTWPGNVRELRNVIERAMAFSPTPSVLRAEHLRIDAVSGTAS